MPEKQTASPSLWFPGVPAEIVEKALEEPFGDVPTIGLDALSMSIIAHAIYGGGQEMEPTGTIQAAREAVIEATKPDLTQDSARLIDVVSAAGSLLSKLDNVAGLERIACAEASAAVGVFVGAALARVNPGFNPAFPDIDALRSPVAKSISAYRTDVAPAIVRLREALDGHGAGTSEEVA